MPSRFQFIAVYIMASRPFGTLYTGSTNDLPRRVWEHREGLARGFTQQYGCKRLVWYEQHQLMADAIQRELAIKHWVRAWKVALIERDNPEWDDLFGMIV